MLFKKSEIRKEFDMLKPELQLKFAAKMVFSDYLKDVIEKKLLVKYNSLLKEKEVCVDEDFKDTVYKYVLCSLKNPSGESIKILGSSDMPLDVITIFSLYKNNKPGLSKMDQNIVIGHDEVDGNLNTAFMQLHYIFCDKYNFENTNSFNEIKNEFTNICLHLLGGFIIGLNRQGPDSILKNVYRILDKCSPAYSQTLKISFMLHSMMKLIIL